MNAPTPQQAAQATQNLLAFTQSKIIELRREADALERDMQTVIASSMPAAALPPPAKRGAAGAEPGADELAAAVRDAKKNGAQGNGGAPAVVGSRS